jgi:hypothetical protein
MTELETLAEQAEEHAADLRDAATREARAEGVVLRLTKQEAASLSYAMFLVCRDHGHPPEGKPTGFAEGEAQALWTKVQVAAYGREA